MADKQKYAILKSTGRYTQFVCKGTTITFLHGKDLIKYLSVVKWDAGYLVVSCLGKIKKEYEDYIDLSYMVEKLYMDPSSYFDGIDEVRIENA